jgi:hypothetical protein
MMMPLRLLPFLILTLTACAGSGGTPAAAPVPALPPASAAPPAPQPPRKGILLSIFPGEHGRFALDAIAIVTPQGLRDAGEIEDADAFKRRYFPPAARFSIRVAGVPVGEAHVVTELGPSCFERMGQAEVRLTTNPGERWGGLASDVFGAPATQPLLRPVTSAERAVLAAFADSIHTARGVPREERREPRSAGLHAVTVTGSEGPLLAGSFTFFAPADKPRWDYSAMVIAERHGGRYHPVLVFYAREEPGWGTRVLYDAVDVDGDGGLELITRVANRGGWYYTILKRGPAGWAEIYRGGGARC